MPYQRSLHRFYEAGFEPEVPPSWNQRLREISPVTEGLAHLRFRLRAPKSFWNHPERPQWQLYACTPQSVIQAKNPSECLKYREHWSELPQEFQEGRHHSVSNYQHYMWHVHGVEAKPFLTLQGEWGGTPSVYTPRERRYLDACNALSEPFPLGFFPACPFDERAVKTIQIRDRLVQSIRHFDSLEQMDRPAYLREADEEAERVFRATYLDNWYETIKPQAEFMQSYLRTSEADMVFPRATPEMANAVSQWRDLYIDTGEVIGATNASHQKIAVAVP